MIDGGFRIHHSEFIIVFSAARSTMTVARLLEWIGFNIEMSDPDISVESLRTSIEEAFTNVKQPDPENVIEHDCPECRAVRRVFRHERWRSLKPEKVDWGHDKLPLFTPHAFQYFLPAFMLYSLDEPSGIVCELLVYSLVLHKKTDDWWQKRLDKFTPNQKAACRLFLRWIQLQPKYASDSKVIERAVAQWWQTNTSEVS